MGSTLPMLPVRPTWSRWHSVLIGLLAIYLVVIAVDVVFTRPTSQPANHSISAAKTSAEAVNASIPETASQSVNSPAAASHLADVRKAYAKIAQDSLLETNAHASVWTSGDSQEELHLKYPQTARNMAHHMEDETIMFQELRQLGFTRVELTDGNSFTQHWDLN
jgi:hypothetical protein